MNSYNNGSTHIPSSILKQYHKIGFKLIPISYDGVTPNMGVIINSGRTRNQHT
jgi:hypothetical protein